MRLTLEPSLDPADYSFAHSIRPRFAETDAMGIIHHSAYAVYLEEARVAYLTAMGHPYREVRSGGVDFAVLELFVAYRLPLHFDDGVTVHLGLGEVTRATFQLAYLLSVDGVAHTTAVTVHGAVDHEGRATRLPRFFRDLPISGRRE